MSSQRLIPLAAAALALAAATFPARSDAARPAQVDSRPNVVFVMTDDQTRESLRVMSWTQRLIGGRGTTFSNSFAVFPLCCPSRATYLSGQYPHNHGVLHNAGRFGGYPRLDHTNTLPVWLQRVGYRTIHVGRYLNGYGVSVDPATVPPGWSDWHSTVDPNTFNYERWKMNHNGRLLDYPEAGRPGEHQTDFLGRSAVEMIAEAAPAPQPFFLSLTFPAPHSGGPRDPDDPPGFSTPSPAARHRDAFAAAPVPRPPSFDEADAGDKPDETAARPRLTPEQIRGIDENYRQELESLLSVDEAVRDVVFALERSGELGNTLLVYTSDNGFMHGEHRWPTEKVLPYEESIRVPLLMRGPGVPIRRVDRRLVANVDLAPTIADATNARAARVVDGRSLLQLLADPGVEWGRDIGLESGYGANGVEAYRGVRTYRFMYANHIFSGEEELYDLRRDPFQLQNRAYDARYAAIRERLALRVSRLRRCRGQGCRARPDVRLSLHARTRRARRLPRCVASDLRVRVKGSDPVEQAELYLGRRRVARDRRAPFLQRIPRRRLGRGREARLRVRATTPAGRVVTLDRRLLACR